MPADVTVKFKGATIAEMDASGSKTLNTAGKVCEEDISLAYLKPNAAPTADDVTVEYRGQTILSMNDSARKAIKTAGKYCDADLTVRYVRPQFQVFGFHIDSSNSDPYACVTYLEDAVGMTPAHMDFSSGRFDYGSWENAFFMPKPCMLNYDGTVAYYLNPQRYGLKELPSQGPIPDVMPSDVDNVNFDGNAMMEWGQNGKRIWYKIVPDDGDHTSASVYIADGAVDKSYRAWSFINNQGVLVDHFYTPIYGGTYANGKLRSLSGVTNCYGQRIDQYRSYAKSNNPTIGGTTRNIWDIEVFADIVLINLLLILMSKSLNMRAAFGRGRGIGVNDVSSMVQTGTLDDKGLFWGSNTATDCVKVFGMESWWGNQMRMYLGHMISSDSESSKLHRYKMTKGTQDGSSIDDYISNGNTAPTGYFTGARTTGNASFAKKMQFHEDCFMAVEAGGTSDTYWCDWFNYNTDQIMFAYRGGSASWSTPGPFATNAGRVGNISWDAGAALSCKPLSN